MKSIITILCFIFLFHLSQKISGQGMRDYYINLKNDTIRAKIEGVKKLKYLIIKVNDKKRKIPADSIKLLYYVGQVSEPVKTKPNQKAKLLTKDIDGDICLYRISVWKRDSEGHSYNAERKYIRHKNQPKGYVLRYRRKKDLVIILPGNCRPIMDSILKKSDWSVYLEDIIKIYNKRLAPQAQ